MLPGFPFWFEQDATGTLLVLLVPQTVAVQLLPELAATSVQLLAPMGPVVTGAGQVVVVQLLLELAAIGVHEAIGVGPVVTGVGQVVVVQLLPEVAEEAEQVATGTLVVLFDPQVIVVQLLPELAVCGVHEATGTLAAPTVLQVIVTQPLPDVGDCGVQVPVCTAVVVAIVWQSVRWKPLALVAATGVHEDTLVGPLTTVSAGQVVVV